VLLRGGCACTMNRGLSVLGRMGLTAAAAAGAIADPRRADLVAVVGETTGELALRALLSRMKQTPHGRHLLHQYNERRSVQGEPELSMGSSLQSKIPQFLKFPKNSFGFCYAKFMTDNGFRADSRPRVRFLEDPELAFVLMRYRECHDFWHTLTALKPTVLGEVAQKWFEAAHTRLPVAALSAVFGPLAVRSPHEHLLLVSSFVPWAVATGARSADLLSADYDALFELDIDTVRQQLAVSTPKAWLRSAADRDAYLTSSSRP